MRPAKIRGSTRAVAAQYTQNIMSQAFFRGPSASAGEDKTSLRVRRMPKKASDHSAGGMDEPPSAGRSMAEVAGKSVQTQVKTSIEAGGRKYR